MSADSTLPAPTDRHWLDENNRRLDAAMQRLVSVLEHQLVGQTATFDGNEDTALALAQLAQRFGLTDFERDLLLLCLAYERSPRLLMLLERMRGGKAAVQVDFDLCRAVLRSAERFTLSPTRALRRWRLIELNAGPSLDHARLVLDERVRFYLEGHGYLDQRLEGLVRPVSAPPKEDRRLLEQVGRALNDRSSPSQCPVIEITGESTTDREAVFASACVHMGLRPYVLSATDIPGQPAEREALARLWEREAMLLDGALLIDADTMQEESTACLRRFLASLEALVFVSSSSSLPPLKRRAVRCTLTPRESHSEIERWRTALGSLAHKLNGSVERTACQFRLDDHALEVVAAAVSAEEAGQSLSQALWNAARERARQGLDSLAERIDSRAGWDDLVLPAPQIDVLKTLSIQVRERDRVYRQWGFAEKGSRGLGIAALFAGASGTGKTLAAEVLANELHLDLYRIDLASLVSKYIGETEKNLAQVFAAAEASGAILLFDEADALFGKRSEVRDSHDRYANIEVSYLLQRIESYRGLSILTTNLKQAVDPAFLRRIRFIVQFPFPENAARRDIWARVFPASVPREALDYDKLARLNLAGGYIRNIALNAAFLAADKGVAVRMSHLRAAAEAEYAKLERPLPRAEVGDWQ